MSILNKFVFVYIVPPDIKDEETISDITVKEGENATLACKAKGNPLPRITWKREDGQKIATRNKSKKILGEKLFGLSIFISFEKKYDRIKQIKLELIEAGFGVALIGYY